MIGITLLFIWFISLLVFIIINFIDMSKDSLIRFPYLWFIYTPWLIVIAILLACEI